MEQKGTLVSYVGPGQSLDLSAMPKDAKRLTPGPHLNLSRKCTKVLTEDEIAYIQERFPEVARLLTKHMANVDPGAKAKKKASGIFPSAPHGLSMRNKPVAKRKVEAPTESPQVESEGQQGSSDEPSSSEETDSSKPARGRKKKKQ